MIILLLSTSLCRSIKASCIKNAQGQFEIIIGIANKSTIAWATWNNETLFTEGWLKLTIEGREGADSHDMLYCAGYLEGYLSHNEIYNHFQLMKDIEGFSRNGPFPPEWVDFVQRNMNFAFQSVEAYQDSKYWQEIGLILTQFKGIVAGYQYIAPEEKQMSQLDFWFFQSEFDLLDVQGAVKPSGTYDKVNDHCSGLIRIAPDYSDIFFSHNTWSDYRDLHNQLKEYHFPIPEYKAHRVMVSTRVGKIYSFDDFYISDAGLLVFETTNSIFNEDLYKLIIPNALFTWIRTSHCMWTTNNGSAWTEVFGRYNSGTLNNQYLILDSNKFVKNEKPTKDLLWLVEQYPGTCVRYDLTETFVKKGFFESFNVPFTKELYELAGYPQKVEQMGNIGDFYSYYEAPRYKIFEREAPRVKTFEDMKDLMTYNNYKRDIYSKSDPAQAIMSRYDLRRYGEPYGPAKTSGGIDVKVTKLSEVVTKMRIHAVGGPNHFYGLPPWKFGEGQFENVSYDGLPDEWEFDWITFDSETFDGCGNIYNIEDCKAKSYCGWCNNDKKCMAGDEDGPFFDAVCDDWNGGRGKALIIIGVVSGSIFLVLIALVGFFTYKKCRSHYRMQ